MNSKSAAQQNEAGVGVENVAYFAGYVSFKGARIDVQFKAPAAATDAEMDAAFVAALQQQADLDYLVIGESIESSIDHGPKSGAQPTGTTTPASIDIQQVSTDDLLAEIARRQALAQVHGAIEALYDQLERTGNMNHFDVATALTAYHVYRLRRESAKVYGTPNADESAKYWQVRIDELGLAPR
ncbi:hypothetical protein [Paraburkholderia sp. SIMBA_054]|uniref:hypothetical protein n=1 Tax=Paraburkholderia sp. SIMBA_054 TaxID=3085795 RepID=UPI00397A03F3